jgi:formate--tetrahydrofolate ligase
VLTEAGFGADMGAERFFNVKCRISGLRPDIAVLVATVRSLKAHSGRYRIVPGRPLPDNLFEEAPEDVRAGAANLIKHIEIVKSFGVKPVVAINAFPNDHEADLREIEAIAAEAGVRCAITTHVMDGGAGAADLAREVLAASEQETDFRYTYDVSESLVSKIEAIATKVYGADGITIEKSAAKDLQLFEEKGFGNLPIVIAKTHLSISHDPKLRGAPTGWKLPIREVRLAAGAGYVYAIAGSMRTMPGLGASPAAERIGLNEDGQVVGLF